MNTFLSIVTSMVLSGTGDVKTGQMLGLSAQPFLEGLYDIGLDSGTELASLLFSFGPNSAGNGLAVSPDGTLYAALAGKIDELVIIDLADGALRLVTPLGFDDVSALAFGPDGALYGYNGAGCQIIIIDVTTGLGTVLAQDDDLGGGALAFSPDGLLYAAGRIYSDDHFAAALFSVDIQTGNVAMVGFFGEPDGSDPIHVCTGLEFIGDTLYASAQTLFGYEFLYTVDTNNGHATEVGLFDPTSTLTISALAFLPGSE